MDDMGLDYPDDREDELDRMLDEEMEIMRELEAERNKENSPHRPTKKQLEFGTPASSSQHPVTPGTTSLRPIDGNVGIGNIGNSTNGANKRGREDENDDGVDMFFNSAEEEAELIKQSEVTTPSSKRFRKTSSPNFLRDSGDQSPPVRIRIPRLGERKVYRRLPEEAFQAVTGPDGGLLYLKMAKPSKKLGVYQDSQETKRPVGLCGVPFHRLMESAETEMIRIKSASDVRSRQGEDSGVESGGEEMEKGELWVEKFKPRSYTQLLSDDGTNRVLLMWLKLWDAIVFNKEKKKPKPPVPEGQEEKKEFSNLPEVIEEYDDLGRPKQRVSLLHGPPGLGKTTLAHIIAKQAGYNVVEMNASDDRSIDAFKNKLENATQMKSVISQDQRPNCLIIDEIDGAPAPTIQHLVDVLSGKSINKKKKGKEGSGNNILRPIICICNDLYTPALRPLRQLSMVVPFPQTLSTRLAFRLKQVCGMENLQADTSTLLALCKKTDNDIRSCLSTLQFFRQRNTVLKSSDIAAKSVGSKDAHKSLFSVWDDIFAIPRPNQMVTSETGDEVPAATVHARYRNILSSVSSCGEFERLLNGVFENFLEVKFKDSGMMNVVSGLEWFVHFDILHQEMMHSQNYSIMGHLPFPLVASHLMFGSNVKHRVKFPTQHTECRNKLAKNHNILSSVVGEMAPQARCYNNNTVLVRDLLPLLISVLQPTLRPVNTQLYSAKEKKELANLVDVHIMYNLTYQQERNLEGQYEYKMDPDVEGVVCFPGVKRPVTLSYGTKQLIAHEIDREKMRRENVTEAPFVASQEEKEEKGVENTENTPKGKKKTDSHLQKLQAKPVSVAPAVAMDFFGRAVKVDPTKQAKKEENPLLKSDIWFKFKEGYTNAVRRTIKMKDLV